MNRPLVGWLRSLQALVRPQRSDAAPPPTLAPRVGQIQDFRKANCCWGHDYGFSANGDGLKPSIHGWQRGIRVGDFFLMNKDHTPSGGYCLCRINKIRYCGDPRDMWFAEASFVPPTDMPQELVGQLLRLYERDPHQPKPDGYEYQTLDEHQEPEPQSDDSLLMPGVRLL